MAKIHINNPKQVINGGAKKYYFKVKGLGGPKGDKGDKGDTGATGPQGPQGNAATVSIGSTTTLPVGQDATVENVGTLYNAVLNFGIPQGPRGPQGATGAKGDKGDKGDQGNPGPQGEKGTNATVTVGTTTTTEPGTQAYAWNSSSNPSNAVINFNIPRGATGSQGPQGIQGPIGPAGADGESFTPVVVSSLPTTGAEGKLYLTPKNYTTGTGTGNPITATITDEAGKIESFQLDGDTFQQSYTGKNLWSATTLVNGYYKFADGGLATGNTNYVTSIEKIDVTAGESYHISADKGVGVAGSGCVFFNNDTFVSSSVNPSGSNFTVPEGANKMAFNFFNSAGLSPSEVTHIQLEAGSTATSYEPYVGGTASPSPTYPQNINVVTGTQTVSINGTDYPLNLGSIELCKLGTYQDYIWKDGDDWKVHKATVSAIIDGSESWDTSGTNTFYVANIYSKIGNSIQSASTGEMYASHFTIADITSSNTLVGASLKVDAAHNVSNLRIRLQDMSGGVAGFRQMLSAKKPSIYARRLTPTDTTITDQTLIAQLEAIRTASLENGTNTITNTATGTNLAGDMEFDYYEYDPINRYDKWLWLRANNAYEEFNEEGGGGGGGSITVDSALSTTSKNPVQNKVVTAAINSKVNSSSLATVATTGAYSDLTGKPTIPTVNNATLTITQNGTSAGTFTANASSNVTIALTDTTYSNFVGSTGSADGTAGLVPQPLIADTGKFLKGDGSWGTPADTTYTAGTNVSISAQNVISATDTTYSAFTGASSSTAGTSGLVPAPAAGNQSKVLTGDGTWVDMAGSYSTSEQVTPFTWIDGKPIYKKTFSFTLDGSDSTTVNHGIRNFGLLIKFEGAAVPSSTKSVPIPRTLADVNYQVGLEGVTTTSFEIDVGANGPRGKQAYVTLWYTKTTD